MIEIVSGEWTVSVSRDTRFTLQSKGIQRFVTFEMDFVDRGIDEATYLELRAILQARDGEVPTACTHKSEAKDEEYPVVSVAPEVGKTYRRDGDDLEILYQFGTGWRAIRLNGVGWCVPDRILSAWLQGAEAVKR